MDNKDFFGYQRRVTEPGAVLPADFATISFGDDAAAVLLLQSFQVSYGHQVQPFFEIGSPNLYWVNGQPMGEAAIGRAVGPNGFFAAFSKGTACAKVQSLSVGIKKSGGCVELASAGKGFNLLNCLAAQISASVQAGALQMQEGISFRVGTLQTSD